MPLIQFLPRRWRERLAPWSVRHFLQPRSRDAELAMAAVKLPSAVDFMRWFPDAEIRFERFLGLRKSIIAIRRP
jgi:hypothetical protein